MKRAHEDDQTPECSSNTIQCELPPCDASPRIFSDYQHYEAHIITFHDYTCNECNGRFPSQLFLNLHIDENHNPFMQIKQQNGEKIFKCFVCDKLCSTPKKRRLHMIDKHYYPKSFNWSIVNKGI